MRSMMIMGLAAALWAGSAAAQQDICTALGSNLLRFTSFDKRSSASSVVSQYAETACEEHLHSSSRSEDFQGDLKVIYEAVKLGMTGNSRSAAAMASTARRCSDRNYESYFDSSASSRIVTLDNSISTLVQACMGTSGFWVQAREGGTPNEINVLALYRSQEVRVRDTPIVLTPPAGITCEVGGDLIDGTKTGEIIKGKVKKSGTFKYDVIARCDRSKIERRFELSMTAPRLDGVGIEAKLLSVPPLFTLIKSFNSAVGYDGSQLRDEGPNRRYSVDVDMGTHPRRYGILGVDLALALSNSSPPAGNPLPELVVAVDGQSISFLRGAIGCTMNCTTDWGGPIMAFKALPPSGNRRVVNITTRFHQGDPTNQRYHTRVVSFGGNATWYELPEGVQPRD